jgi:hypothetical protein
MTRQRSTAELMLSVCVETHHAPAAEVSRQFRDEGKLRISAEGILRIAKPGLEVQMMLRASTPNLVRLSFSATDSPFFYSVHDTESKYDVKEYLEYQLFLTFRSLHDLELRGWPLLEGGKVKNFLSKHSSMLRELRLVDCFFSEDLRSLRRWVGKNMFLNKVDLEDEAWQYWRDADLEALWLTSR